MFQLNLPERSRPSSCLSKEKPFIYQDLLLKAQDEAKQKKLGIWSK